VRWQPHTNVIRSGRAWVGWPRSRWQKELKLSADQFRLVLLKAAAAGLIYRCQMLRGGLNVLHIALTDECILKLVNGVEPLTPVREKPLTPVRGKPLTLYKNPKKEPGESTKIATDFAVASSESEKTIEKSSGNVVLFPGQGGPMNKLSADIGKKFADASSYAQKIDTLKPDRTASLVQAWRGSTKATVTDKMAGQLKYLLKTRPNALKIVRFALKNWGDLTYRAEKHHGAFKSPSAPNLGYLVKFAHVAVELMNQAASKPVVVVAPPVQSIAQTAPVKVKVKPATFAEILAIEAELEALEALKAAS